MDDERVRQIVQDSLQSEELVVSFDDLVSLLGVRLDKENGKEIDYQFDFKVMVKREDLVNRYVANLNGCKIYLPPITKKV